jgi:tRNA (cytidine/uridine-2'-O-)-methyltransferase
MSVEEIDVSSQPGQPSLRDPSLHVVLYQPEIPQNTGNIGRTCVALGAKLWIVQPAGFRLDSAHLRRAGLDYWEHLDWEVAPTWEALLQRLAHQPLWLVTKFGQRTIYDAEFTPGCVLVIGRESNGLPESLRSEHADRCLRIPMPGAVRSLNQACAASLVMYEAALRTGILEGISGRIGG